MNRELKSRIEDPPGICTVLTIIGAITIGLGLFGYLALVVAAATTVTTQTMGEYVVPIYPLAAGLVLLALASIVRDVHVIRLVSEHQAEAEDESAKVAASIAAAE